MQVPVTTVIDLSPIGGSEAAGSGYLQIDNGCEPNILVVSFAAIGTVQHRRIMAILPQSVVQKLVIHGATDRGEKFSAVAQLQVAATISSSRALQATFILADLAFSSTLSSQPATEWRFPLFNWSVHRCDSATKSSDGSVSRLNRIEFTVERRKWTILDHTVGRRDELQRADHHSPLVTAILIAPTFSDDPEGAVQDSANDICMLLSLALGRRVNWAVEAAYSASGNEVASRATSRIIESYGSRGICPIDNFEAGVIQGFIESAYAAFRRDIPWFRLTLGYYCGTRIRQFVDVRSIILFMLLDRIADRVLPGNHAPRFSGEIDSLLSGSFAIDLDDLLSSTIPNWTNAETSTILRTIKHWNRTPSYGAKIRHTCAALQLPPPSGALLTQRHKALHTGRFNDSASAIRETWLQLDWLVLSMLLRLLNYTGLVFHPTIGAHPMSFADAIAQQVSPHDTHT